MRQAGQWPFASIGTTRSSFLKPPVFVGGKKMWKALLVWSAGIRWLKVWTLNARFEFMLHKLRAHVMRMAPEANQPGFVPKLGVDGFTTLITSKSQMLFVRRRYLTTARSQVIQTISFWAQPGPKCSTTPARRAEPCWSSVFLKNQEEWCRSLGGTNDQQTSKHRCNLECTFSLYYPAVTSGRHVCETMHIMWDNRHMTSHKLL